MSKEYGLLAEFETADQVVLATERARVAGFRRMDAFSPQPVEGLAEALGQHGNRVPLIVLIGGAVGCATGLVLQQWCMAVSYPINIGGRPLTSWPAWVPIMFELTILIGGLAAVFGMLALNGLPTPYHPLFHVPAFDRVTRDRFFLCIEARDPQYDPATTRGFLESLGARQVYEVPL